MGFNSGFKWLNPICHLLTLGAHHILHVSRIRVKLALVTPRSEAPGAEAQLRSSVISALHGGECKGSRSSRLTAVDSPRSGCWLDMKLGGPRAGLDVGQSIFVALPGIEPRFLGRPTRHYTT